MKQLHIDVDLYEVSMLQINNSELLLSEWRLIALCRGALLI